MLTSIRIRNFKRFDDVQIELGEAVVLIGPNNSGKTTVLQALALWEVGVRRWMEKGKNSPDEQAGATINRLDLISTPVPFAGLLWRHLAVSEGLVWQKNENTKVGFRRVPVEVVVEGITNGKAWSCGLEFEYANEESFYCRPLRNGEGHERMPVPEEAAKVTMAFLPPMSGLADREFLKQQGEISVLIGQGQTAQVLRNLCYQIYLRGNGQWDRLVKHIRDLFRVDLIEPIFTPERSEISMSYREGNCTLDLSSSGRGLQQTLLLLAHLYANPGSTLLLDEPDAHLEFLRQRQTYNLLTQVGKEQGSQIIAASHSEVVLSEAAGRDTVIALVGRPHRMDDRGSQVLKALRDIGFDHYLQAEETGWVLYLESPTDLSILRAFAKTLEHGAQEFLAKPFVHYVETNLPQRARDHFFGLREGKKDLVGIALFDRLEKELQTGGPLEETMWRRREIENYFCMEDVLLAYARHDLPNRLFGQAQAQQREQAMREAVTEVAHALRTLSKPDPWSADIKASDEFLEPLFKKFFEKLQLPLQLRKSEYHVLASLTPRDKLDHEITEKLDGIVAVARRAKPRTD